MAGYANSVVNITLNNDGDLDPNEMLKYIGKFYRTLKEDPLQAGGNKADINFLKLLEIMGDANCTCDKMVPIFASMVKGLKKEVKTPSPYEIVDSIDHVLKNAPDNACPNTKILLASVWHADKGLKDVPLSSRIMQKDFVKYHVLLKELRQALISDREYALGFSIMNKGDKNFTMLNALVGNIDQYFKEVDKNHTPSNNNTWQQPEFYTKSDSDNNDNASNKAEILQKMKTNLVSMCQSLIDASKEKSSLGISSQEPKKELAEKFLRDAKNVDIEKSDQAYQSLVDIANRFYHVACAPGYSDMTQASKEKCHSLSEPVRVCFEKFLQAEFQYDCQSKQP